MAVRTGVGIDVGGTKVLGLLVSEDGSILREELSETPAEDLTSIMETIYRLVGTLREGADPVGVGVGAAGMVDFEAGMIRFAPNLVWAETPIRDLVVERTGLPCVVDNDANAATWAEYRFGAGRGYRHLLVVTVGTGIGGGIVTDGYLSRGSHGFAAEIGHFIVEPDGPWCGCGNRGCWEQVASGQALDRMAREVVEQRPDSLIARLAGAGEATGVHVWEAARAGDRAGMRIIQDVGRRLGQGIAGLVNVLDPDAVVVGGGVADIGAPLLDPARRAFLDAVEAPRHRPEVPIAAAALGNRAGAIGAAALALDRSEPR